MKVIVTEQILNDLSEFKIPEEKFTKLAKFQLKSYTKPLFDYGKLNFIFDDFVTDLNEFNLPIDQYENFIIQIKKANLIKFKKITENVEILYSDEKKVDFKPWDLSKYIYNSKFNYEISILNVFTKNEDSFKSLTSFLMKEFIRIKLLYKYEDKFVANILNEKLDYKYKDALSKVKKIEQTKIDKSISLTNKVETYLVNNSFETSIAKRYLVSIKKLLEI